MAEGPGTKRAGWLKQETLIRSSSTLPSLQNANMFFVISQRPTERWWERESSPKGQHTCPEDIWWRSKVGRCHQVGHRVEHQPHSASWEVALAWATWAWENDGQGTGSTRIGRWNPFLPCLQNTESERLEVLHFAWEGGGLDLRTNLHRIYKLGEPKRPFGSRHVCSQRGKR